MGRTYKGCVIDARAYERTESGGWTAEVYVAENARPGITEYLFILKDVFPNKEAALDAALARGKREVDRW